MSIEEATKSIKQIIKKKHPILIAIDGFGGSGKSTVADKLCSELGDAQVIRIDDFIVKECLLEVSAEQVLFDRERLVQQILKPLSQGKTARYQKLKWAENELSIYIDVLATKYVIIEGISSAHPEIADYYDFKIWVDTPIELAKQRGSQRDRANENEQHWDLWSANDLAYQLKYHPEEYAEFVIANE